MENPFTRAVTLRELEREVVAVERTTVPAGEFEAYKIVAKGQWKIVSDPTQTLMPELRGRFEVISWYAPAAKRNVAVESSAYFNGRLYRRTKAMLAAFELH